MSMMKDISGKIRADKPAKVFLLLSTLGAAGVGIGYASVWSWQITVCATLCAICLISGGFRLLVPSYASTDITSQYSKARLIVLLVGLYGLGVYLLTDWVNPMIPYALVRVVLHLMFFLFTALNAQMFVVVPKQLAP